MDDGYTASGGETNDMQIYMVNHFPGREGTTMLQAIAGADGLDPRQYHPQVDDYVGTVGRGVGGVRIGVVKEGFGHPVSEAEKGAQESTYHI